MGQIMGTRITNNSKFDLDYSSSSNTVQNMSGSPYQGTLKAGGMLDYAWEKDSALVGGGFMRDAHIEFHFSLNASTTVADGPITRTWPKFRVLLLKYFDSAQAGTDWTLTAAQQDLPPTLISPPFALPSISATAVVNGHATVTIS
ncbi:MAG: hypothetical protein JO001_01820 [Alphaproteobacteria bacterium]|nr:hypothetical protein [Alphaproteobacteria bacterium]